jgi:uncharacterized protein (TIGR00251 family)
VPGASRSEIVGVLGDRLKLRVSAPAEGGKANRAIVTLLKDVLGVENVEITRGVSRSEKTVRVYGDCDLSRFPFFVSRA